MRTLLASAEHHSLYLDLYQQDNNEYKQNPPKTLEAFISGARGHGSSLLYNHRAARIDPYNKDTGASHSCILDQ